MGVMDETMDEVNSQGRTPFATSNEKDELVMKRIPFQLFDVKPRHQVGFDPQWALEVGLLRWTAQGSLEWVMHDDEEGPQITKRLITLKRNDFRDQIMGRLQAKVAAAQSSGVGPLKLVHRKIEGQQRPAYHLDDWKPGEDVTFAQAAPAAAAAVTATTAPPPPPSAAPPPPPPAQTKTYAQTTEVDGVQYGWSPGMAGWEKIEAGPPPPPPGSTAQPIPPMATAQGGDGEGGQVAVQRTTGPVREATYEGAGVTTQPNGNQTQAPVAETPQPPPPPSVPLNPSPVAETPPVPKSKAKKAQTVMVRITCPNCEQQHDGPAFQNADGKYITTHQCPKQGSMIVLDADEAVKATLAGSPS